MIALILEDRCDRCNACVDARPTDVLEMTSTAPTIARIDACQTCYMGELYCAQNAIMAGTDLRGATIWTTIGCSAPCSNEGAETAVRRYQAGSK
jgi:NAD-dependent dihydropyrimidine dehydrogenase PreA subunit